MTNRNRLHSLLWTGAVVLATALSLVLMLQVKAVNSEIAATDKAIVATKQQIAVLETEFQTRARQQQLVRWNEVDFGYVAPRAGQFLEGEVQLAALGRPARIIEAAPIRLAAAEADAVRSIENTTFTEEPGAPAPVRMASAARKPATLAIEAPEQAVAPAADRSGVRPAIHTDVRLASAQPVMRQLAAHDNPAAPKTAAKQEPAKLVRTAASESFAERFDLDAVIAEDAR